MKFRTAISALSSKGKINIADKVLSLGSCFSENIGQKLAENKFNVLVNPFGTLFDPLSITRLLTYSIENSLPNENTYVQTDGVYKCLELHSSMNGLSKSELALKIRANIATTHNFLKSSNWLFITLGTSFVYNFNETSNYIANCQKLPAANFTKELITVDLIREDFTSFLDKVNTLNQDLKVILTVSPVRHSKEGLSENNLSKSILRVACSELEKNHPSVHYYPAYEIMMDDLRDYRFYTEDMLHPTSQAIEYIWQHFSSTYLDKSSLEFIKSWKKVTDALNHRPFNPSTTEHQDFLKQTFEEVKRLKGLVSIDKELALLQGQII